MVEWRGKDGETTLMNATKAGKTGTVTRQSGYVGIMFRMLPDGMLVVDVKRSEEHTSELQSHSFISYAVFCLKKKKAPV